LKGRDLFCIFSADKKKSQLINFLFASSS